MPPGGLEGSSDETAPDEGPPFLGTWRNVYVAVLCYLGVLIGVLYAITRLLAPQTR